MCLPRTFPIAVLLSCAPLALAQADCALTFDVVIQPIDEDGEPSAEEPSRLTLSVVLGEDVIAIRPEDGPERIYDFAETRVLTIDRATARYMDDPLDYVVGFRVFELQNRIMLRKALDRLEAQQQGISSKTLAPPLLEHLFAIDWPDIEAAFTSNTDNGTTTFAWRDTELLAYSEPIERVEPACVARFVTFLRYDGGAHPELLAALKELDGIPVWLRITRPDPRGSERTLKLRAAEQIAARPIDLDGLERVPSLGDATPLTERLEQAWAGLPEQEADRAAAIVEASKAAVERGDAFAAFLAVMAYGLQRGEPFPDPDGALKNRFQANERIRHFATALQPPPGDQEAARAALETLQEFQGQAEDFAYLIPIFRANVHTALGEHAEAEALFLEALEQNPFLAGAWKDLGDLYFQRYEMPDAWRCWDLGRTIAPEHRLFEPIKQLERTLRAQHPEYFRPDGETEP